MRIWENFAVLCAYGTGHCIYLCEYGFVVSDDRREELIDRAMCMSRDMRQGGASLDSLSEARESPDDEVSR